MFYFDINDFTSIIIDLIILSFLILNFFIKAKDNFWYKFKILLIWIFIIFIITIMYNNKNILFKNTTSCSTLNNQNNSLVIKNPAMGIFAFLTINSEKYYF